MLQWLETMKRRVSRGPDRPETRPEPVRKPGRAMTGKYLLLHKYLNDRYANTVVLTFAEIEDLLGFTLPDPARLQQEWWTGADPNSNLPSYADSWILASRTAKPNMNAGTVEFERLPS
jgi:hypothetical protein